MASPLVVTHNGVEYAVAARRSGALKGEAFFTEDTVPSFREALTVGGISKLVDALGVSNLTFPNFIDGFGRDRIDSDSALKLSEYRRCYYATNDIRFARQWYNPILEEDSTESGLEVVRASVAFKGNLWSIWEDDTGTDIVARKYTGSSTAWSGGGSVEANSSATIGLKILAHKTHMIVLSANGQTHNTFRSTDGASWAAATTDITTSLLANNITLHENFDAGLLASVGNQAVAIIYDEDSGTVTFFSSADAGNVWVDEAVDIASGNGPQGVAVMNGIDNAQKLYVATREGIHEVDTAPGTWTFDLVFPMVPHNDNGRGMIVADDGTLWFAQGVDNDSVPIVYQMSTFNGVRQIQVVPNDFSKGDGLPEAQLGPIRDMISAQGMVYVAAGGGKASRNASIFVHNGRGWSSMRAHGDDDEKIEWLAASGDDDGTPRLHYAVRTGTAVSNTKFLGQAFVNPVSGVSVKREASGYIDLPYVDLGFPLDSGPWLQVGINAEDLSATNSNEFICVDYGIDDGSGGVQARTTTDLGDFLSGTSKIDFASGAGVDSVNLGLRVNSYRDATTNTHTPKGKDVQIAAVKETPVRERFTFAIDIKATMALPGGRPGRTAENIVTNWKAARDLKTIATFTYGPVTTSRYVKVRQATWRMSLAKGASTQGAVRAKSGIQREGYVDIVLEEVV
jgi:hypothetical protein